LVVVAKKLFRLSQFTSTGGDFFGAERSEWDPETLEEGRYDAAKTMRMFEEANAR
jgi:hypothetical protein